MPLAGGTLTGPLIVPVPTATGHALRQGSAATVEVLTATGSRASAEVTAAPDPLAEAGPSCYEIDAAGATARRLDDLAEAKAALDAAIAAAADKK